jgi:hypothetical protein
MIALMTHGSSGARRTAASSGICAEPMMDGASHADPRTATRYDLGRASLDRHATYTSPHTSPEPLAKPLQSVGR